MNIQNEEQMLKELGLSNANPFKTPEGYFDTLSERIMARIDEEETKTAEEKAETVQVAEVVSLKQKKTSVINYAIRWAVAAAACLALVFVGVDYFGEENKSIAQNQTVAEEYDDEYAEDMISYSMMDESDVYCYLAGLE
jgi:hypothetical protein